MAFRSGETFITVIHDVDLTVHHGRVLGVVGESGSGKTVSSLACLGLLPASASRVTHGKALFKGKDLLADNFAGAKRARGAEIAMVFQEPMSSLNPSMRCGEQVAESIRLHRGLSGPEAWRAAVALFAEVELPHPEALVKRYPHELSGGQKQRVMIAMALAGEPDLIIADEPTTALDVTVQNSILLLLRRLQKERSLSMLFISHDLDVVARVADDVAVMWKGRVVEQGRATDVLRTPNHAYTKGLLACKPPVGGPRFELPTVSDALEGKPPSQRTFTTSKTEQAIIEARSLSISFVTRRNLFGKATAHFDAVSDVSFTLFKGETLGIVGESGCGKSTLSRMVMGLLTPDAGTLHFTTRQKGRSPAVQLVFQDPFSSLNPRMTAAECLIEALLVSGVAGDTTSARQGAIKRLTEVGLHEDFADRYPHAFSGGQRQRLVIARALCTDPEVLILDESVAALDISVQAQVLNLLNTLKEERGLSFIFISHDLRVVQFMSDRIMVMYRGRIEETGTADQVMTRPTSDYTKRLIASGLHNEALHLPGERA